MADDAVKLWRKKFGNTHINLYSILTKLHADNFLLLLLWARLRLQR